MVTPTLAPPRQGWIRGSANGSEVDLDFSRVQHTVSGTINDDSVHLSVDHDYGQIEGRANGYPVDLDFDWTPTTMHVEGVANGKPLRMDIDYNRHTISGHNGMEDWKLAFDHDSLEGMLGDRQVDLELDTQGGRLIGTLGGQPVNAEMINLDMGDVASNLFLFAKPQ